MKKRTVFMGLVMGVFLALLGLEAKATELSIHNHTNHETTFWISSKGGPSAIDLKGRARMSLALNCPCTITFNDFYLGTRGTPLKVPKSNSYWIYDGSPDLVRGLMRANPYRIVPIDVNLARGKRAWQNSTGWNGPASRGVDGVTNGNHNKHPGVHTQNAPLPWWQVDLGKVYNIYRVGVFNRTDGGLARRLNDAVIMVSDWPFTGDPLKAKKGDGIARYPIGKAKAFNSFGVGRTGRYVRVQMTRNDWLNMAEVVVMGKNAAVKPSTPKPKPKPKLVNLARGKRAVQNSTGWNGPASRAVDGVTDGNHKKHPGSHTQNNPLPWWQVDLGKVYKIDNVRVFNRTDYGMGRIVGAVVMVSDWPFRDDPLSVTRGDVTSKYPIKHAKSSYDFDVGRTGRYVRVQMTRNDWLNMAEVMVMGKNVAVKPSTKAPKVINLAIGRARPTQSSSHPNGPASKAVDGNTDGRWNKKSVSHTNKEASAWWQVDLGAVYKINDIAVHNRTDCCSARLDGAVVIVSDWPFKVDPLKALRGDGISRYAIGRAKNVNSFKIGRTGRYVRVQQTRSQPLNIAEVEVMGEEVLVKASTRRFNPVVNHLARGKKATQSSSHPNGPASKAVDGNTDGNWNKKSVSHTKRQKEPWWQVDLGAVHTIKEVTVHNRTDCCMGRLYGAVVMVSEKPFTGNPLKPRNGDGITRATIRNNDEVNTLRFGRKGRYVRVQIPNHDALNLAEVVVVGSK